MVTFPLLFVEKPNVVLAVPNVTLLFASSVSVAVILATAIFF